MAEDGSDGKKRNPEKDERLSPQGEKWFQQLFENAPVGYQSLDENGYFIEVNQLWLETLGYQRQEVIGKWFGDFLAPEYVDAFRKRFPMFKAAGKVHTEFQMLHKNGSRRYIEFEGRIGYNPDGSFKQTHCILADVTERKQIEETLRENEERFRTAFATISDSVMISEEDTGRIIEGNEQLFGYTRQELVEKTSVQLGLWADPNDRKRFIEEFQTEGFVRDFEAVVKGKDGSTFLALITSSKITLGNKTYLLSAAHDITKRKRAEEALKKSQALLLEMTNHIPSVVYQLYARANGEIGFYYISDSSERILGVKPDLDGYLERVTALVIPEHRQDFIASIEKSVRESSEWKYEWMLQKPSGEKIWFSGNFTPSPGKNETVFNGIVSDITERKQAEDALRKSEERFKVIASNTPDHVIVQDRELRYSFVLNPQLGLTEQDMIGKTDYDFLTKEDADNLTRIKRQVLETANTVHAEVPLISLKGETEFFSGSFVPKYDTEGHIDGLIGYFRNVTELKRAQEALQETHNNLKTVFESITDSFFSIDSNRCFTYVNSAAEKLLRKTAAELLGKNIWELFPPAVGSTFYREYERALNENKTVNFEEYYPPFDSWFEVHAYPSKIGLSIYFRDITERKLMEESLRESERRLSQALSATSDAVWEWNYITNKTYYSQRWYEMLGYDFQEFEMNFEAFKSLCHPDDFNDTMDRIAFVLKEQKSEGYIAEFRMRHKNGQWIWIQGRGNVVERTQTGEPLLLSGTNTDITERKQAEEQLKQLTQRLSLATESANLGVWDWDLVTNTLTWDARMYKMYGISPDKFANVYEAWLNAVHPDDRQRAQQEAQAAVQDVKDYHTQFRVMWPNGQVRYIDAHASFIRSPHGKALRMIGVNLDVTERKLAEESLRKSESRYRELIELAVDGILLGEKDGRIIEANAAIVSMIGMSRDDLLGQPISTLFGDDVLEKIPLRFDLVKQGLTIVCERPLRRRDGKNMVVEMRSKMMPDGTYQSIIRDVTERILAEKVLKDSEERFRILTQIAPAGIYLADEDGKCLYANERWQEMAGLTVEESMGYGWVNGLHPDDRQRILDSWNKMVESNGHWGLEYRFQNKKGKVTWVYGLATPQYDESGNVLRYVGLNLDITDRKYANEALLESEKHLAEFNQLLAGVLGHTHMMAVYLDPKFNFIWVNQAYANSFGHEPSFFPGKNHFDLYPHSENRAIFQRVVDTGRPFLVSGRPFVFPDQPNRGVTYWDWSLVPIKDSGGKVTSLVYTLAEVTERIKSQEKYLTLFREMIDGFALHEIICNEKGTPVDYRYIAVNPAFEKMTGFRSEDIIGKTVLEVMPKTEKYWIDIFGKVALTGKPAHFDNYAQEINKYFEVKAFQTQKNMFACVFVDITARKQAEKIQKTMAEMLDTAPNSITVHDYDGKFLYANHKTLEFHGYTKEEFMNIDLHDLDIPESESLINKRIELIEQKGETSFEVGHYRKDGSILPLSIFVKKVEWQGKPCFLSIGTDITDRKLAEAKLQQTQRELEHTSRLILAGELAAGLAHELNQPLCAVANYTEACSQMVSHEKIDFDKVKNVLDRITTQTVRAGDIIKRLRKLVNKHLPCTSSTDINDVIQDVLSLISSETKYKSIVVESRLTENLPLALVDNVQIQQVFINLVKNAVEVMQDSDIENRRLTIETSIDEDDTISISFKDTGKGIAAGEYENIFSSFYTTKKDGLGLGLSLSRSIIEAHGGYLWAEPNPEGGAVFRIRLPLKKADNGT